MDASGYVTLSRQMGLQHKMDVIANNIANISTNGFRREAVIFSEYIKRAGKGPSLSIGFGNAHIVNLMQASITQTGGALDLAVQGKGFFLVSTPTGQQMTRAGSFTKMPDGTVVTNDGYPVLDASGSSIVLPPGAQDIMIANDGTMSSNGVPLAKIGLYEPTDPMTLNHKSGTLFSASGVQPATGGKIIQGYLEDSNVDPMQEIASMISVQRAYELGQSFLDNEDGRARNVIQTLGR